MSDAANATQAVRIERRHHRRYSESFLLFYAGSKAVGRGYARNLSEGGIFVETKNYCEPETPLQVEIFLDLGDEVCSAQFNVEVVWSGSSHEIAKCGMRLRFVEMKDNAKKDLLHAISRLE